MTILAPKERRQARSEFEQRLIAASIRPCRQRPRFERDVTLDRMPPLLNGRIVSQRRNAATKETRAVIEQAK